MHEFSQFSAAKQQELRERVRLRLNQRGLGACWYWMGRVTQAKIGGKRFSVRRLVYWALGGRPPLTTARRVDVTCGDAACCNPAHLVLGRGKGGQ